MDFTVVVEVPKGSRNKYEVDHRTGLIHLDRELFTAMRYPADYGYIEDTLGRDGDPLDVLVHLTDPTFPGCRIHCRALGVFRMTDEAGSDDKVLAVPTWEGRLGWTELADVPESFLLEVGHFFEVYKALEPGKHTVVRGWEDRAAAEGEIDAARRRASGNGGTSAAH